MLPLWKLKKKNTLNTINLSEPLEKTKKYDPSKKSDINVTTRQPF